MSRKVMLNSDWEGPWVTADHAYAAVSKGVPNGDELFERISLVDDYFYYVERVRDYAPGDTLFLVAPFLIACGRDESFLREIAEEEAKYIAGSIDTLRLLDKLGYNPTIISTSYEQYVDHTVERTGVPKDRRFSTRFPLDSYTQEVSEDDKKLILSWIPKIIGKPKIDVGPSSTKDSMSLQDILTSEELYKFFFEVLQLTSFRRVMQEIRPIGGYRKTEALEESLRRNRKGLSESVTVGDSITDEHMLRATKEGGGLAISFNGNGYAVKEADIAIMSSDCIVTSLFCSLYDNGGHELVGEVASNWSWGAVKMNGRYVDPEIRERFRLTYPDGSNGFPKVALVTPENVEQTTEESKKWRKAVRGHHVGSLG